MSEFLEERLSVAAKYGASYGDSYEVEIISTSVTGKEYRKLVHPFPVRHFSFSYDIDAPDLYNTVANLYHKCFGSFVGIRVKTLDDYTTNQGVLPPTENDQSLLYVSSGVYQLINVYGLLGTASSAGLPYRILRKPVTGTVLIAKNGILLTSGVSVDFATGLVTITPAPTHPADVITGGCEFDIPARFDDMLQVVHKGIDFRDVQPLSLKELLDP